MVEPRKGNEKEKRKQQNQRVSGLTDYFNVITRHCDTIFLLVLSAALVNGMIKKKNKANKNS